MIKVDNCFAQKWSVTFSPTIHSNNFPLYIYGGIPSCLLEKAQMRFYSWEIKISEISNHYNVRAV